MGQDYNITGNLESTEYLRGFATDRQSTGRTFSEKEGEMTPADRKYRTGNCARSTDKGNMGRQRVIQVRSELYRRGSKSPSVSQR